MNLKPLNLVLADDDTDDCNFFKSALSKLSLDTHLTIVNDGEELMKLLGEETSQLPEVIFLDLNMPRKNGSECLAEIKKTERLRHVAIVIFSTSYSRDTMELLFKAGAHVYIRKPGNFEQLQEVIFHALPLVTERISAGSQVKYIINA
jgi:CheY-like chemotaxis protein